MSAGLAQAAIVQGSQSFLVSIDTASLAADSVDQPFALALQFNSGGTTGVQNTATLSNFSFNGGQAEDNTSIFTSGDATGTLTSGISLDTDGGAFSYYQQNFTPGTSISFTLNTTCDLVDPTIDTPDGFAIQLLDAAGVQLPTLDPSTADTVLTITYDNPLSVETFASDPTRTTTGGATLAFAAPTITAVPEPSVAFVLGAGLSIALTSRRNRR